MSLFTPLPPKTPVETAAVALTMPEFLQQLVSHRHALESFLERNLCRDQEAIRLVFRQASATRETLLGEAHLLSWEFGIALTLVRQLKLVREQTHIGQNRDGSTAEPSVGQALAHELADLPADVREILLLVASGVLSIDEASLMPSLSLSSTHRRLAEFRQQTQTPTVAIPPADQANANWQQANAGTFGALG